LETLVLVLQVQLGLQEYKETQELLEQQVQLALELQAQQGLTRRWRDRLVLKD
jgi:hypothetical protein